MKKVTCISVLALIVSIAPLFAQTAERSYYVSANGSDSNNGRREDAPFETLQKAVDSATAGVVKTITILGPVYNSARVTNAGVAEILIIGKEVSSKKASFNSLTHCCPV
ncbi:hypothetical protein AGMMS49991_07460 [Spirochaetia bacterium]|nr:hypothetical protein AGMMS49991_07460 [Spirochaetia bacterium]